MKSANLAAETVYSPDPNQSMTPTCEVRPERRQLNGEEVTLKVLDWAGVPNPMQARVLEAFGSGLRLQVPRPLVSGARVEIHAGSTLVLGEISRCHPESRGYSLGVRVCSIGAAVAAG